VFNYISVHIAIRETHPRRIVDELRGFLRNSQFHVEEPSQGLEYRVLIQGLIANPDEIKRLIDELNRFEAIDPPEVLESMKAEVDRVWQSSQQNIRNIANSMNPEVRRSGGRGLFAAANFTAPNQRQTNQEVATLVTKLDQISHTKIKDASQLTEEEMEMECPVCLTAASTVLQVSHEKWLVRLSCNHLLCEKCAEAWIQVNPMHPTCPICRVDLKVGDAYNIR